MVDVKDLTIEHFRNIRTKAGALLIVFPEDVSLLSLEEKQVFNVTRSTLLKTNCLH